MIADLDEHLAHRSTGPPASGRRTRTGAATPAPHSATCAADCCRSAACGHRVGGPCSRVCCRSIRPTTASRSSCPASSGSMDCASGVSERGVDTRAAAECLQRRTQVGPGARLLVIRARSARVRRHGSGGARAPRSSSCFVIGRVFIAQSRVRRRARRRRRLRSRRSRPPAGAREGARLESVGVADRDRARLSGSRGVSRLLRSRFARCRNPCDAPPSLPRRGSAGNRCAQSTLTRIS